MCSTARGGANPHVLPGRELPRLPERVARWIVRRLGRDRAAGAVLSLEVLVHALDDPPRGGGLARRNAPLDLVRVSAAIVCGAARGNHRHRRMKRLTASDAGLRRPDEIMWHRMCPTWRQRPHEVRGVLGLAPELLDQLVGTD